MKRYSIIPLCLTIILYESSYCFSQNWIGFTESVTYSFKKLYADSNENVLYAAGLFGSIDNIQYSGIATWDGENWDSLGNCNCNNINAVYRWNGEIYADQSCVQSDGAVKWNGTVWETVGGGLNGGVIGFTEFENDLILLGAFTEANGQIVNGIVKWDGQQFEGFGDLIAYDDGDPPWINCGVVYNGELYVGGNFSNVADTLREIAKWDGTEWTRVGDGFVGGFADVRDMEVYHDELYVVGAFSNEGLPNPGNFIARWNGSEWHDVGGGLGDGSAAWDLIKKDDYLYVCGSFKSAGGVWSPGIARWDGSEWCSMNDTMLGFMLSMAVMNDELYLSGGGIIDNGDTLTDLFKWVGGDDLQPCSSIVSVSEVVSDEDLIQLYPNPTTNNLIIETGNYTKATYSIYDVTGRLLQTGNLLQKTAIDISGFSEGVYVVQLQTGDGNLSRKFIKR